jgi:hypothetical protein
MSEKSRRRKKAAFSKNGAVARWQPTMEREPSRHQFRFSVDGQWQDDSAATFAPVFFVRQIVAQPVA